MGFLMKSVVLIAFLLIFGKISNCQNGVEDPSVFLKKLINHASGEELIPQDAKFQVRQVHGSEYHECKNLPGGGRGCVSGSSYTNDPNGITYANGYINSSKSTYVFSSTLNLLIMILMKYIIL